MASIGRQGQKKFVVVKIGHNHEALIYTIIAYYISLSKERIGMSYRIILKRPYYNKLCAAIENFQTYVQDKQEHRRGMGILYLHRSSYYHHPEIFKPKIAKYIKQKILSWHAISDSGKNPIFY